MQNYPKIIAICGRRRSGKDTIADILCKDYGYHKIHIADLLKKVVQDMFDFDHKQLETNAKDEIDPRWGIAPREAMQFFGTNVMQYKIQELIPDIGKKFWIKSFLTKHIDENHADIKYVIPDLRFLHEEEELRKRGAVFWRVIRPQNVYTNAFDEHISEHEWTKINVDHTFVNDASIEDLQKSISTLMPISMQSS